MKVHQINISQGGVPKLPVEEAKIKIGGLEGDKQKHTKFHGGPERAVCLYSLEKIDMLNKEGHPIYPGALGENLTLEGVNWEHLRPGVRLSLGDAILEITSYTVPCKALTPFFKDGRFIRISEKLHPSDSRLYAKILKEGTVRSGDRVTVHQEPHY